MLSNTSPIYGPHSYESTRGPVMAMAQEAWSLQLSRLKNTTSKENDDRLHHKSKLSRELVKPVYKGNNTRNHSLQEPPGELKQYWNSFILTSVNDLGILHARKIEVFKVFKKFKNLVEKQSGRSIKVLRSDRGKKNITTQNSTSSVKKRVSNIKLLSVIILNKMECQKERTEQLWRWQDRCCRRNTCQKLFGQKQSTLQSIYSTEKRHKLEEKIEKGIFLGYSTQSKGYRIYNLKTKKLIISRDVEFDEDAMWNWDEEKVERQSVMIPKETLRNNNKKKEQTKQKWKGGVNKHQDHPEGHHH
ncbi:hypothetical protein Sango_2674100 [Sesamum angolense]|uniref:Retroviral polymerase SH3-like domain-containing protein n=1 Tax=Sesamum angolense TaxID=2727404 RepID=A0AAE1W2E2_9LAMI|nr:hypothetical protein Sango_2674100 [Sesamum angolense]